MIKKTCLLSAGLFALTAFARVQAQPIAIGNAGFENDFVNDGFVVIGAPTGWSIYNPQNIDGNADSVGLINPTGTDHYPGGAAEGRNAAVIFMDGPATGEAGLFQTLSETLQPGLRYTLEVEVGNIASGTANFGFFNLDGFPGYRIDLLAGSTVIASDDNSLAGAIPEGEFRTSTLSINVSPAHSELGQTLGIRLVNLNIPGTQSQPGIEVNFDNVRLTAMAVPEPGVLALTSLGVLLLWRFRNR